MPEELVGLIQNPVAAVAKEHRRGSVLEPSGGGHVLLTGSDPGSAASKVAM